MGKQEIINYYSDCKVDFKTLYRLEKAWGMHAAYFEDGERSLTKGILKMNEQIIIHAPITEGITVLDAGCGYAGTAMYIAERIKCHIEAITIVEEQVKTATKIIKERKLDEYINISVRDYTNTGFPDNTFDVVYGLESICYADKPAFLKETYRILKPGGVLIIYDGFNSKEKDEYTSDEWKTMSYCLRGWAVDSLETGRFYIEESKKAGFKDQEYVNITDKVIKTSKYLHQAAIPGYFFDFLGRLFKKRTEYNKGNVEAARYQYICHKKHLCEYGYFRAVKG